MFWIRRWCLAFVVAGLVIAASHWLRQRGLDYAVREGLLWGAITASVFVAARLWQSRRGQHCALCRDTPEMRDAP